MDRDPSHYQLISVTFCQVAESTRFPLFRRYLLRSTRPGCSDSGPVPGAARDT